MNRLILALTLALIPAAAAAASQVTLTSHIALVRTTAGPNGKAVVSYEEPKLVTPGDRLLFTLDYSNVSAKAADNFVVTDPIPQGVAFMGHESSGAQVSVDGGKTFGPLASLKVADPSGSARQALPADVTHVRWSFTRPIAAGEHGELRFEAVVK
jgi:uncharacterized repeat protein (TIGR01451 family)